MAGQVKAKILVCNGNDDPFVPAEQVKALIDEMTNAGADWQIINYGGTVHSFTNPEADSRNHSALKYNKLSDERSWKAMTNFFDEILCRLSGGEPRFVFGLRSKHTEKVTMR
jgi:dienelactone hydrolase